MSTQCCWYCDYSYDTDQMIPYFLSCGCTLCYKCIMHFKSKYSFCYCPECKETVDLGVVDKNIYGKLKTFRSCILHNMPLNMYCSKDSILFCEKCKDHTSHPFTSGDLSNCSEKITKELINDLEIPSENSNIPEIEIINVIDNKITKMLESLKVNEKNIISYIQKVYKEERKKIKDKKKELITVKNSFLKLSGLRYSSASNIKIINDCLDDLNQKNNYRDLMVNSFYMKELKRKSSLPRITRPNKTKQLKVFHEILNEIA